MAWPSDLNSITSNMNTTELWALKEQMETNLWNCDNYSGFAENSSFDVNLFGITYKFTELLEQITNVVRYE